MPRRIPLGLIPVLLCLPPSAVVGQQEGTIAYKHSVRVEIPPELRARMDARGGARPGGPGGLPTERVDEVVVLFNASESLMRPVPAALAPEGERAGGPPGAPPGMGDRRGGMLGRMRMGSTARRDRESVVEAHVQFEEGSVVESREFLGRRFLIEDEQPVFQWKLTGEQAEYLGYLVQKATAQQDSSVVEAWFTPQIPVPGGPELYGGLPGMILVVSVDDGAVQYSATGISLTTVSEGVIVKPTEGERVSRARYEEIVAEKLAELRTIRN